MAGLSTRSVLRPASASTHQRLKRREVELISVLDMCAYIFKPGCNWSRSCSSDVNRLLLHLQVKSVKTGSVFWTIGCCLSYFYMVRTTRAPSYLSCPCSLQRLGVQGAFSIRSVFRFATLDSHQRASICLEVLNHKNGCVHNELLF